MLVKEAKVSTPEALPAFGAFERVVAAERVAGSPVFSRAGQTLGTVESLMLDKVGGKIAYAVVSLAEAPRRQALPWCVLTYDPLLGGYVVNLDRIVLENGPTSALERPLDWNSEAWNRELHEYYRVPHFWI